MAKKTAIWGNIVILLAFFAGCAKRIPISYDQAQPQALVKIQTVTGKSVTGIVRANKPSFVILQTKKDRKRSLVKINHDEIAAIQGENEYDRDALGKIISPWEIEQRTGSKNTWLYTAGGLGLSFGISFFIGSLINRGMDNVDQGETAMWTATGAGTALGTFLFAKAGAKKDRKIAVDKIRKERYEIAQKKAEEEKLKRKKILDEIERLKRERLKQDAEMKRLLEKSKRKKKK
ncbi:MAG: hypothetical protein GXO74_14165 [Calditrichaeota bacterium]|nr:hypothetical protein [Calditrichota bacterium]